MILMHSVKMCTTLIFNYDHGFDKLYFNTILMSVVVVTSVWALILKLVQYIF